MGIKDLAQGALLQSTFTKFLEQELQLREIWTLEILNDEFGFTVEQLNEFVDFKIEKIKKAQEASNKKK